MKSYTIGVEQLIDAGFTLKYLKKHYYIRKGSDNKYQYSLTKLGKRLLDRNR